VSGYEEIGWSGARELEVVGREQSGEWPGVTKICWSKERLFCRSHALVKYSAIS